ncbi:hypothetical protein CJD38_01930 [Stenotrophobium rhamnosiphilum]|uniref:Uncharacterized protein n=1 Tax=Stenotrophobium rhamnosiphilum TaxID=2029166 RepID=A0A2T5MJY2_9GAMM|nr:hypothetical protein CJD38_01930 [Stenotrophobium rhamnosiphilum]
MSCKLQIASHKPLKLVVRWRCFMPQCNKDLIQQEESMLKSTAIFVGSHPTLGICLIPALPRPNFCERRVARAAYE